VFLVVISGDGGKPPWKCAGQCPVTVAVGWHVRINIVSRRGQPAIHFRPASARCGHNDGKKIRSFVTAAHMTGDRSRRTSRRAPTDTLSAAAGIISRPLAVRASVRRFNDRAAAG